MEEYYKQYLENHYHPKCKLMHFIGQLVTIAFTLFVLYNWYWYLIPLIPFVIYPFAISGHVLFQDWKGGNRPSFLKMGYIRAKICDLMMFRDILLGKHKIW